MRVDLKHYETTLGYNTVECRVTLEDDDTIPGRVPGKTIDFWWGSDDGLIPAQFDYFSDLPKEKREIAKQKAIIYYMLTFGELGERFIIEHL